MVLSIPLLGTGWAVRRPFEPSEGAGCLGNDPSKRGKGDFEPTALPLEQAFYHPLMDEGLVPDLTEPLLGFRVWLVVRFPEDGPVHLRSFHAQSLWPTSSALEAECMRSRQPFAGMRSSEHTETPPAEDCTCGIYALKEPSRELWEYRRWRSAWAFPPPRLVLVGEVQLWGKVRVAQRGYRAQFARPACLWEVEGASESEREYLAEVRERYGLPSRPVGEGEVRA